MATKIRLTRRGRKARPIYDIIVADSRAPRDGKFIEKLGQYNPNVNPHAVVINEVSALDWLLKGAQPTETVRSLLSREGLMFKKHLQVGVNKGAITQETADARFNEWKAEKDAAEKKRLDGEAKEKAKAEKEAAAERQKIKEEVEAQKAAAEAAELVQAEEAAAEGEEAPAEGEEAATEATEEPAAEAEATEEAPAAEEAKEEAPAEEAKEEAAE